MKHDRRQPNRASPTWLQFVNPIWWLGDIERNKAWPTKWLPEPLRCLCWFTRNPFCNAFAVIIGIAHRSRTVAYSTGDGHTYEDGLNYGWSKADESNLKLPFISYRSRGFTVPPMWKFKGFRFRGIETMTGWKTSGCFTPITLRIARSKGPQ